MELYKVKSWFYGMIVGWIYKVWSNYLVWKIIIQGGNIWLAELRLEGAKKCGVATVSSCFCSEENNS